ncbi:hypothetical protein B296_00013186 [Ensete ventricosum]|uniref:Uncharacterized protein n=1 Tax=Ensete ventricosum TaxID=4639 RepID=A0A427B222_ENSVE|nr:hypothetical protein B296_00013186 [Ensete ventricosum]
MIVGVDKQWEERKMDAAAGTWLGGAAGGDYGSKGGWLQPSVVRRGGRMGNSGAIEGWKATTVKEEAAIWLAMAAAAGKRLGSARSDSYNSGDVAVREWAMAADLG